MPTTNDRRSRSRRVLEYFGLAAPPEGTPTDVRAHGLATAYASPVDLTRISKLCHNALPCSRSSSARIAIPGSRQTLAVIRGALPAVIGVRREAHLPLGA